MKNVDLCITFNRFFKVKMSYIFVYMVYKKGQKKVENNIALIHSLFIQRFLGRFKIMLKQNTVLYYYTICLTFKIKMNIVFFNSFPVAFSSFDGQFCGDAPSVYFSSSTSCCSSYGWTLLFNLTGFRMQCRLTQLLWLFIFSGTFFFLCSLFDFFLMWTFDFSHTQQ